MKSVYDHSRMDLLPMSGMCSTTPVTYLVLVLSGILSRTQLKGLLLLEHLPDQPSTPCPPNSRITPSSRHAPRYLEQTSSITLVVLWHFPPLLLVCVPPRQGPESTECRSLEALWSSGESRDPRVWGWSHLSLNPSSANKELGEFSQFLQLL